MFKNQGKTLMMKFIGFMASLLLLTFPILAQELPKLVLKDAVSTYDDFEVSYCMEEIDSNLSIKDMGKCNFSSTANAFSFGHKKNNFWFRFAVYNDSDKNKNMVLEVTEIFHKTVDLYAISENIRFSKNGLSVPLESRQVKEANPSFNVAFKAYERKELYVHLQSDYGVFAAIKLKTDKEFEKDVQNKKYIYLMYLIIIALIALYNLVLFFYLKEVVYLYYIAYVFVFILWVANYKGVLLPFITMEIYNSLQITIPIFFTLFILFSRSILGTEKYFPKIDKVLHIFIAICMMIFMWMLVDIHSGMYVMNLISTLMLPFLLFVAFWALHHGHSIAKIYLLALSIYIFGISWLVGHSQGLNL